MQCFWKSHQYQCFCWCSSKFKTMPSLLAYKAFKLPLSLGKPMPAEIGEFLEKVRSWFALCIRISFHWNNTYRGICFFFKLAKTSLADGTPRRQLDQSCVFLGFSAGEPENNQVSCQPNHCPHLRQNTVGEDVREWEGKKGQHAVTSWSWWIWKRILLFTLSWKGKVRSNLQQRCGVGEAKSSDKRSAHCWTKEVSQGKGCNMSSLWWTQTQSLDMMKC